MRQELLTINGQIADMSGDAIALTFAVNDLSTLGDRQSTYSNNIKLPKTRGNKSIFGYSHSVPFTQGQPYKLLSASLKQNGLDTIIQGQISLLRVSDYFECQLTYGLVGFLDKLKLTVTDSSGKVSINDALLTDLDWSDIPNFNLSAATISASQQSMNPLFAVIDYGDTQTLSDSSTIKSDFLRPGVIFSQIWARIAKLTGYTFTGGDAWIDGMNDYIPFTAVDLIDYEGTLEQDTHIPLSVIRNLPDIKVIDFIKDYIQRYFLTPIVDNFAKTIKFLNFDEVYNNKTKAKDWTNRFINDQREDTFTFGNYGQNNRLLWNTDDFPPLYPGYGSFEIDNENLDAQKDLLTSIFAASYNGSPFVGGYTVAQIPLFSITVDKAITNSINTRVLHLKQANGAYAFVDGNSTVYNNTGIQYGYFYDYQHQLDTYGQGLLRMLQKARQVARYAILTVRDIAELDFSIPIYDANDNAYYYINKISNYISGNKVQVNLIKL